MMNIEERLINEHGIMNVEKRLFHEHAEQIETNAEKVLWIKGYIKGIRYGIDFPVTGDDRLETMQTVRQWLSEYSGPERRLYEDGFFYGFKFAKYFMERCKW